MIRSALFTATYYIVSVFYVLLAAICLVLPGRKIVTWVVQRYAKRMVQALHYIAGIKLEVIGRDTVPANCIIAAKHHSWFDGFCMYSQFDDMAFVTGDHLEKIPLLSGILAKLGAIVVDNCGGHKARAQLAKSAAVANEEGRRILIYPEGHLSPPGTFHRYRSGVWHMSNNFNLPVVPVATNLGVFAPQQSNDKSPGTATLKFLEPIPPGLPKAEFMARLQAAIEGESDILIAQARGGAVTPSTMVLSQMEVIGGFAS
jgi:1-acyl-sn-glycerol-3-phosphate acyltransferase